MLEELSQPITQIQDKLQPDPDTVLPTLPDERLEELVAWGRASRTVGYVFRPSTVTDLRAVLVLAQECGRTVTFRAGGNTYGDAGANSENIVLSLTRMNRILEWDPRTGKITVEPGVTLQQMWQYILGDGWWIPIATGTMKTTVGGCAAMNTHGKNAWKVGHFGDHIEEFDLLLASGEIITCNRQKNSDVFYAAIGGFGMLGCFTRITMQMKRIYSGLLNVFTYATRNLHETITYFEEHVSEYDYFVGWVDAFSKGRSLGRADLHMAKHLAPGEDPSPGQTLRLENQQLPPEVMGIIPNSIIWRFQRPFWNNLGMGFVNMGKYWAARLGGHKQYRQPHALFHFLLDYFDWDKPFGPGGLIQYQAFIPADQAERAYLEIFHQSHKRRLPNYLSVLKRHRPDDFLMSYALDGYSMAMDFRVTKGNRTRVVQLTRELDEIVLKYGGRFYLAKDSTLRPEIAAAYLGEETLTRFRALKQRLDPNRLLESNLWRRVFSPLVD